MTIINPKSIAGVTSITTPSGSDNLFTVHTNNTTERIRINNDGDVIVGSGITVSPDGDIFTTGVTTATTFVGALTGNVTGTASGNAVLTGSTNNQVVTVTGANAIAGESGLTFNGNSLTVTNSSSNTAATFQGAGGAGFIAIKDGDDSTVAYVGVDGGKLKFQTSGSSYSDKLIIDTDGRLLLNATTEGNAGADDFTIGQLTGSTGITIRSGTTNNGNLYFSDGTSGDDEYRGSIQYQHANNSLHIATNAVERLRIEADGDFRLSSDDADTNYGFIRGWDSSTGNMIIGADQSATGSSGSSLIIRTRGGERARILHSGGITFNGDTATANALDDYEEGTFTPSWNGGSGGVSSITYGTTNGGNYVKIGNLVTVTGKTDITASSGGSGFWYLSNMPFLVYGGGKAYNSVGVVSIENFNMPDSTIQVVATMEQNNNNMHLHDVRDNQSLGTGISVGNDGAFSVQFSITYRTA